MGEIIGQLLGMLFARIYANLIRKADEDIAKIRQEEAEEDDEVIV